jgi:hypothetical protein
MKLERNEILKLLAFLLLQDHTRNLITTAVFLTGKIWKYPYFWTSSVRGFTFYSSLLIFFTTKIMTRPLADPKDCINPYWIM